MASGAMWGGVSGLIALSAALAGCGLFDGPKPSSDVARNQVSTGIARYVSSLGDPGDRDAALWYYTESTNTALRADVLGWRGFRGGANARWDWFSKMFYANTKNKSNAGLHHVACYTGDPQALANDFFNLEDSRNEISFIDPGSLEIRASSDNRLIGVDFKIKDDVVAPGVANLRGRVWHFRVSHCTEGGKAALIGDDARVQKVTDAGLEVFKQERLPAAASVPDVPSSEDGFNIFDKVTTPPKALPTFKIRGDYARMSVRPDDRPWKGMDITTPDGAEKFALLLQSYFYKGMADQDPRADFNFIADKNKVRDWCHMPWLNVGEAGREAVHGLTKERDLQPSGIYPRATPGSDWGIGFYNAAGCKTIGSVFGNAGQAKPSPDFAFEPSRYPDGTVSSKILFTTADFAELKGAFEWTANVSLPNSTVRKPQTVRHVQMDIAVKDSSLKGAVAATGSWVMVTYYYDASYTSPLTIPGLPEGLRHMRPQGIQTGFDEKGSIIFAGALTNCNSGNLNGPADNPKSSCLSCHATAGTKVSMSPGFTKNDAFLKYKTQNLDFSQQMALAQRNYETRAKPKK